MIRFIDTTTATRFESPLDTGETKTVFLLGRLNSQEVQLINDATFVIKASGQLGANGTGTVGTMEVKQTLRNRLFVLFGLRGWENADKPYESAHRTLLGIQNKETIKEELLNQIPIDIVNNIGERIAEISLSTGIDSKN